MANWTNEVQPFGPNRAPLLTGVSALDGITPIPVAVDPSTGKLQVSSSGSGGADTQYTDGATAPTHPIGNALTYSNGTTMVAVSSTNPLPTSASLSASSLAINDGTITSQKLAVDASGKIGVNNFPATQAISAASLPLPTNAAQETGGNLASVATNTTGLNSAVGTAASAIPSKLLQIGGSDGTNARAVKTNTSGQLDIRPLTSSDQVTTVPSGTQTVSGTVTVQQSTASSLKVDLSGTAANTTAIKVDGSAVTQPVSGTVTANAGTGSFTVAQATAASLNATVVGTGTFAVQAAQSGTWTVQPGNTANTTPWLVKQQSQTTGGATPFKLISAATTNATSVKANAGTVYGIQAYNNSSSTAAYLKLYNKASAPTVGTDTPVKTIMLPAGGGSNLPLSDIGIAFGTGIAFAITGAITDADTTAVAASQVAVNIDYA